MLAALPDAALCPLDAWTVIRLRGPDAAKFLQGQVTCDVRALGGAQLMAGAQCDFKGKVWMLFWLLGEGEDLLLLTLRDSAAAALPELKKYAAFSKVEVSDASTELALYGAVGVNAASLFDKVPSAEAPVLTTSWGKLVRLPWPAARFICVVSDPARWQQATATAPTTTASLWTRLDIEAGYPQLASATVNQYVPQALNLHLLDGISFTKGCYMGQETVARMKYRGGNKRGVFRLQGQASSLPAAGSDLELQLDGDWRRIGVVLQAVVDNGHAEVQAVLPLDTQPGSKLRLAAEADSLLHPLPLSYPLEQA